MATATLPRPAKAKRLWTYDEMLAQLPETNQPTELWNGEIIMPPAPCPSHQSLVANFWELLNRFVKAKRLGRVFVSPIDIVLTPHRVVQPDVVFIATANLGIICDRIRGVPDLAVEVISEGSWRRDRIDKKALYEQFGLPEYWLADEESRTLEVFALVKGVYQLHAKATGDEAAKSKLLPGFKVSFREFEG